MITIQCRRRCMANFFLLTFITRCTMAFTTFPTSLRWGSNTALRLSSFPWPFAKSDNSKKENDLKSELLRSIKDAKNDETLEAEERVRGFFTQLEKYAPSDPNLLDDPDAASALDGEWELLYTVAEFGSSGEQSLVDESGDEEDRRRGVQGAINGTGIMVDTTGAGVRTTQTFDVGDSRVANDILTPLGFGGLAYNVRVSGPFSRSEENARRANVRFDTIALALKPTPLEITIGWLFSLVYAIRTEEKKSWLETTHLSKDLRLSRGSKGSLFVLRRPTTNN